MNDPFAIVDQTKPGIYRVEMNLLTLDGIKVSVETDYDILVGVAGMKVMGYHLVLNDHPVAVQCGTLDDTYTPWQTEQLIVLPISVLDGDFVGGWQAVHDGMLDWAADAESERIAQVFPEIDTFLQGQEDTHPEATPDQGIALIVSLYLYSLAQQARPSNMHPALEAAAQAYEDQIKLFVFEETGCWL